MKTKASVLLAIMLVWTLLGLPVPVQATAPEMLVIDAQLWMTSETTAAGIFWTNGLFIDSGSDFGDASEVFFIAANTIHGVKTLVGAAGTITIHFQAQITPTGVAEGRYVIVSGTGAYEKLHGVGTTSATLDLSCLGLNCPPNIVAHYEGTGHFD